MQPKVVQEIMGHQHYSTTIDIYTHVTGETYEEETNKFGRAMEPDEEEVEEFEEEFEDEETEDEDVVEEVGMRMW